MGIPAPNCGDSPTSQIGEQIKCDRHETSKQSTDNRAKQCLRKLLDIDAVTQGFRPSMATYGRSNEVGGPPSRLPS